MNKTLMGLLAVGMILAGGCKQFGEMTGSSSGNDSALQTQINRNSEMINRLQARNNESAKLYEDQLQKMAARINTLQDKYAQLVVAYNSMRKTSAGGNTDYQNLQRQVLALRRQLAAERKAREAAINQMANQLAKETASAINQANSRRYARPTPTPAASSSGQSSPPYGTGKFIKYTVPKGATLSAIAKAANVTVREIKQANGLKSDFIRVGQILYIPKK